MDKHKSQHGSFSSLLSSLFQQGLKSPPPVHAYSWMTGGRLLSTERELAAITKSMKGDFGPALMPIASPNANKFSNWLIAIWAGWDFESENPSAKIEVSYVQGYGKAFHFRFESPHRGRHGYRHAQFSKNISNAGVVGTPVSNWEVHESTPAFPLPCSDEAGLLVACAVSIYGSLMDEDLRSRIRTMSLKDEFLRSIVN